MSIINHVTLQKIVAHDFRYAPRIFREWVVGGVDWIKLVQDRDRWRALVNAVMSLRGSIKCGEFLD